MTFYKLLGIKTDICIIYGFIGVPLFKFVFYVLPFAIYDTFSSS